jgi:FkbM family methyltransferase
MSNHERLCYRVLLGLSAITIVITVSAVTAASKLLHSPMYFPHELSKYRDVEYPFSIEIYGYKYRGKTGDYIDDHILAYGAYEKDVLFFMRDYIEARKNPDAVFLDVGACEGQHSLFMSRLVASVHAFEPYPSAADRFQGLIDLNKFTNIQLHRVGLGDKEAFVPFFAPPDKNMGSGTFLSEKRQGAGKPVGTFRIVNGDDWLEPLHLPSIDVIKIDVEGFEKYVLQGLAKSLRRYRPVLVIEVSDLPTGKIANRAELLRLLPEDYKLLRFQLTMEQAITGKYQFSPLAELGTGTGYCMVLAYPKDRELMIKHDLD